MNYYVYILESISTPDNHYTGFTTDLRARLKEHNYGHCPHTSKYVPWKIKNAISFTDKQKALRFEIYLKSSSGRAFTKKHF
jgi:putative endonuclease